MTTAAITAIASPAKGLMVYDSTRNQLVVNMGTSGSPDWENIISTSGWSLTGNANTNGTAVLGTTDDNPIGFKVNGYSAGTINDNGSVALGYGAYNTPSNNWQDDIAIGGSALNLGCEACIGIGGQALYSANGAFNIGIGFQALQGASGSGNTGVGEYCMTFNTGNNNSAYGSNAGGGGSGSNNIDVGYYAGGANTTGSDNTAIGYQALLRTSGSLYNTAVGYNAGYAYDNGYNNVFVGANNDVNGAGYYNVIAIGQGVVCTASSQARIGNSATNSIGGYADWTNFSDGRYKKNIREGVKGLDFIMRLRPITYNLDVTGIRSHLGQQSPADAGTQQSIAAREREVLSGFAAQEVEAAAASSGYAFSGVDKPKNANDFYGLRYGDFVVPLVKAVQEQQQMIAALQQKTAALEEQNRLLIQQLKKQ
jgi:hypothetical protein